MVNAAWVAGVYLNGWGVPQDYGKAYGGRPRLFIETTLRRLHKVGAYHSLPRLDVLTFGSPKTLDTDGASPSWRKSSTLRQRPDRGPGRQLSNESRLESLSAIVALTQDRALHADPVP
jgi:hypothetical protein